MQARIGRNSTELDLSLTEQVTPANLVALFKQLPKLRRLSLRGSNVKQLPPAIGLLADLQDLDLSYNQLTTLPREMFSKLQELRYLNLSHNLIKVVPKQIGLLQGLRYLNLSHNQLKAVPSEIAYLGRLRVLRVAINQLTELPPGIGALSELQLLNAALNHLDKIPHEVGSMGSLRVLNLASNALTSLPAIIAQLPALRVLDVSANEMLKLPREVAECAALKEPVHEQSDFDESDLLPTHPKATATTLQGGKDGTFTLPTQMLPNTRVLPKKPGDEVTETDAVLQNGPARTRVLTSNRDF